MQDSTVSRSAISTSTWIGLLIALFAMLVVRDAVLAVFGPLTTATTVVRESLHWLFAIALLLIVRIGERQPFSSIGLGTCSLGRSLLWSVPIMLTCLVIGFGIAILTHFNGGHSGESLAKLPLWLVFLIVARAGVVEELFYRGYAIERLQAVGLNKWWAAAVPLVIFSVGHWTGGWANILIAFALGAVLSGFYLWRRDLVANMIAHFAVDFVGVILPRLTHH
jgi:membrane protease YdiL (CAAX protease family)